MRLMGVNDMRHEITDETIEHIGILAKLELTDAQKEQAKKDMSSMLEYIDKLNELDTTEAKPMSAHNVFREDVVTNTDMRDEILQNAPQTKDGQFKVPVTI